VGGVQYARTEDGTHVAYRVLDAGPSADAPRDLVLVTGGTIPLELYEEQPDFVRMLDGLRGLGRVVLFDRRGIGLSDPVVAWDRPVLEQWADDLAAVVDAAVERDVVVVSIEGFGVATRFAVRHPERVSQLVLYDPITASDERWDEFREGRAAGIEANLRGENDLLDEMAPSRMGDASFRDWYDRAGRVGASPAAAQRMWASVMRSHPREQLLDQVTAPVLVLHRRGNTLAPEGMLEHVASLMPDATIVEVEGRDAFAFVGDVDTLVAEIANFVTGERKLPPPDRHVAVILFSDLVGSTERAAALGDDRWKSLLNRHDEVVRTAVGRAGGTVVKTTGDGVLAVFPSASGAIRAAARFRTQLVDDDLQVRVGIHVGDVDRRGDDVSGIAVNIAARVMSNTPDGLIAVTASVVAAVAGQGLRFEPAGSRELKGVPGSWELFTLADADA
jgi:class 3 adenylate cyclase/alpha-beta hydrolase superfamily lysophospholipase